jgi:peptide/nickel transport system substrate-binding protein
MSIIPRPLQKSRRRLLIYLICSLMLLVAVACAGPAAPETTSPPAAEPTPAAEAPAEAPAETPAEEPAAPEAGSGGTLTIAMEADIDNLDPQAGIGIVAHPLFAMFDPLVFVTRDVQLEPGLALSWEALDDTTYRYQLREGVTFHSGNPFNAEAVKASIERFLEPGVPARDYNLLNMIDSVEVEGPYTVLINLSRPFPAFPHHTGEFLSLVVDVENANELGDAEYTLRPSGTGPFMLERWEKNNQIVLVRNPDYWQEGRPYLERVVYRVIPDDSTRIVALEAGEVDIVVGVTPSEVERLRENPDLQILDQTNSRSVYIGFAFDEEPFTDIRFRQALSHAVNVDAIVEFVQEGTVEKATTYYPSFIFGSAEGQIENTYDYDPEQASALLEEAGWVDSDGDGVREKDGERLELTMTFPSAVLPAMRQTAEVIQQDLAGVGIALNLNELEWAAFVGEWFEKNVQMYMMGISATTGSLDVSFPNQWVTDGSWNASRYSNPEVDELFAEASTILDDDERREKYQELQQILAEDVAAVPLFHMRTYAALRHRVQGFEVHPLGPLVITGVQVTD